MAAPSLGGGALLMGDFVTFELVYARFFESSPLDVIRGSACMLALVSVCVDVRYVAADYGPNRWDSTTSTWVRIGVGLAAGTSPPF